MIYLSHFLCLVEQIVAQPPYCTEEILCHSMLVYLDDLLFLQLFNLHAGSISERQKYSVGPFLDLFRACAS